MGVLIQDPRSLVRKHEVHNSIRYIVLHPGKVEIVLDKGIKQQELCKCVIGVHSVMVGYNRTGGQYLIQSIPQHIEQVIDGLTEGVVARVAGIMQQS